jgi:hypothetical protein
LRRAKAVAALRGETVSDIVRDALEAYIAEARLAAGTEVVYEHDAVWREIAAVAGG